MTAPRSEKVDELYIGRRMASRILPATSVDELLGPEWDGVMPEEGSRAELDLASRDLFWNAACDAALDLDLY